MRETSSYAKAIENLASARKRVYLLYSAFHCSMQDFCNVFLSGAWAL